MAESEQLIKHIWVITGPAGCGKTTVANHLASALKLPYIEGDEFHTPKSVEKMHSGQPLEDADRWDWLVRLREAAVQSLREGSPGVVLTCSALKRKYRDVLRIATYFFSNFAVHFVVLSANEQLLLERVKAREGHFMKDNMVRSQFESLEPPAEDERDCLIVDVSAPSVEVQTNALEVVKGAIERTVFATHAMTSTS